jgi:ABC-type multidrug transport system ATPase subunit
MESVMDSPTISLPYVLRKRADLISCLSSGAPWYFLDEPTLGQDEEFVAHLSSLLKSMAAAGAGIIVVAHENPLRQQLEGLDIQLEQGKLHH